jgi:hypothetical protein
MNDTIISKRSFFQNFCENSSNSSQMAINNIASQDFYYESTGKTFITEMNISIIDAGNFSRNNFGANATPLINGFRIYYTKNGIGKIYLTDAIIRNSDYYHYHFTVIYHSSGAGDNGYQIICHFNETPIYLINQGRIGIELDIDNYSTLSSFRANVRGYTIT